MIKNVIFDIGQVLKGWHPERLNQIFEEDTARVVRQAIWGTGYWKEMDLGIHSDEELMEKMLAFAPEYEKEIRYTLSHLSLISEKYEYAIPWIEGLKRSGYKVYYLSNYSRHLRKNVPETISFLPLMDGGVFSCDVNLMKPDERIYRLLCDKYQLVPEECLFLDDVQENVEGAIAFGMQSMRFDGYEKSYANVCKMLAPK